MNPVCSLDDAGHDSSSLRKLKFLNVTHRYCSFLLVITVCLCMFPAVVDVEDSSEVVGTLTVSVEGLEALQAIVEDQDHKRTPVSTLLPSTWGRTDSTSPDTISTTKHRQNQKYMWNSLCLKLSSCVQCHTCSNDSNFHRVQLNLFSFSIKHVICLYCEVVPTSEFAHTDVCDCMSTYFRHTRTVYVLVLYDFSGSISTDLIICR